MARSQSAASAALAELESAVGAPLFDRVGRRLALNENGRALLPGAIAMLDQAAELQGLLTGTHAAPLRMAASLTIGEYLLPDLIARWHLTRPASPVRLTIGNTSEVIAAVVGLDVDVGFIEGPQTHPDLRVHPWLVDELVIVAAPGHPAGCGVSRPIASSRGALDPARTGLRHAPGRRQLADRTPGAAARGVRTRQHARP